MVDLSLPQKALLLHKGGNFVLSHNEAIPKPGPGQFLIKIKATALNPADWKDNKYGIIKEFPAILGFDIAGEVAALGEGITKFKVGDRVMTLGMHGKDYAAFQEYTLAEEIYAAKIPSNVNYDQAAALPGAVVTPYIAFYNKVPHGIGLVDPLGTSGLGYYSGNPFVVLGGAASVGQTGIQFAKLSGFSPIIVTASPKHADYLKSLGATHVLDRNLSVLELKSEINKITNQPINYVFDTVSSPETQNVGIELLAPGGHLMILVPNPVKSDDKHVSYSTAALQFEFNSGSFTMLYSRLTELVENGSIKPNRVEVLPGGLLGVTEGLGRLEGNKISGIKLVVRPEETVG